MPHPKFDYASSQARHRWLHHPVLGDPSWDSFEREAAQPLFKGSPPFEWPVNGFLFLDPRSGRWYAYISQYPRGYWGTPATVVALREDSPGVWTNLGTVLSGQPGHFSTEGELLGLTLDPSVVYVGGTYHMAYSWATVSNQAGGLGYACAENPEGPFEVNPKPIHTDDAQPLLLQRYIRSYAPTLLRRENDWLILHMMSTAQNLGGTWALCAMTATHPAGPYTPPTLLLYPQSEVHIPALLEFYPAFVHGGRVYAPATSLAANRSYQVLYAADLEQAHLPEAWKLEQSGSLWHETLHPSEAVGIWGQTLAGQVSPDGELRVLAFSRSSEDLGTVHLARRPWLVPYRESFVLAAPNAASHAVLRSSYKTFALELDGTWTGRWSLSWGCAGPLSSNQVGADAVAHPAMRRERYELYSSGEIVFFDEQGEVHSLGQLPTPPVFPLRLEQRETEVHLWLEGEFVWSIALPARAGRLEVSAETGAHLETTRFEVTGAENERWERWLALEGLSGAAVPEQDWQLTSHEAFRYGFGYVSDAQDARAKWNFEGRAVRLLAPRGPQYGQGQVWIDGTLRAEVDFYTSEPRSSETVFETTLEPGRHALSLRVWAGSIPCDLLEVLP